MTEQRLSFKTLSSVFMLICLLPWNTRAATPTCNTQDLSANNVAKCDCAKSFSNAGCKQCIDPYCKVPVKPSLVPNTCSDGCVTANLNCDTCFIYFGGLCECLKGTATSCRKSGNWWMLNSHTIITSSQRIPGILQVGTDNGGWQLGQTILKEGTTSISPKVKLSRKYGTLSLNSVLVRDQEQVHIHLCENTNSQLRKYLSSSAVKRSNYQTMKAIPTTLPGYPSDSIHCQASQSKSDSNIDVAKITSDYLKTVTSGCDMDHVGNGLITDDDDYSWVCVTTQQSSGEQLFCGT
ncbi:hypothetical protein BDV26DRAFT_294996 [Aspergillus bertholletiae]|uniref:EGF-like domain-containing protein n=1 Tax=Aspergillus bertholletiae TaxID=1226010 RepID=A0A5N7B0H3_9EURO|nr:hypothetical protein BDV26DRAFT_294996 [Aspergillus bertholletiae]